MDDQPRHDQFLKSVFQHLDKARAYFEEQLPPALAQKFRWETLERQVESYVDEELRASISDVVFRVQLKDSDKSLFLSILLEHKSYPDKYVTIQMGAYIFNALRRQVRDKQEPTPVLPVLFYHGRESMPYRTHRSLYDEYGALIQEFIPDYAFVYHDLQQSTEDELLAVNVNLWRSILLLMKYARDEDMLFRRVGLIFNLERDDHGNFLRPMLIYYFSLVKEKKRVMEAIQFIPEPIQGKARNAYEELILEGMEKGMEQGLEQGLEKGLDLATKKYISSMYKNGFSIDMIARGLELTEEKVRVILAEEGLDS